MFEMADGQRNRYHFEIFTSFYLYENRLMYFSKQTVKTENIRSFLFSKNCIRKYNYLQPFHGFTVYVLLLLHCLCCHKSHYKT